MGFYAFLAIGIGAATGAWLRWGLGMLLNPVFPTVPLGTLAANLLGGFLMGMAMELLMRYAVLPSELRLAITTDRSGPDAFFITSVKQLRCKHRRYHHEARFLETKLE